MPEHTTLATSPGRHRRRPRNTSTKLFTATLISALFTRPASAVTLSAFLPSIDPNTLTPSCSAIYTSSIPTCSAADFSANSQCSSPCITSLVTLSTSVYNACGGDTRNDQLLVGQFLAGNGIGILCKGVVVVTMSGSESSTSMLPGPTPSASSTTIIVSPSPSSLSMREPTSTPTPTSTPSASSTHPPSQTSQASHPSTHSTHHSPSTHTTTRNPSHTSRRPTTTASDLLTHAAQAAQAQYSHCIEYEANPFKDCRRPEAPKEREGQGNGGVPVRAESLVLLLVTGALAAGGAWIVGVA